MECQRDVAASAAASRPARAAVDRTGHASPVEEQDRPSTAFRDRGELGKKGGGQRVAGLAPEVDELDRRHRSADARRKAEPLESRPALCTRSRAAVHGDGTFDRGALRGDRARVVPRIRLLLERRVVLLVDDDEAQARHRREDRRSSSDDDRRSPGRDPRALVTSFRVGQPRVENRDPIAEACAKAPDGLRRQRDLRDEHDDGAPPLERRGGGLQVDLGLPASSRPMEQHVTSRPVERSHDPRDSVALLGRQLVRFQLADERAIRRLARRTTPSTRMRSHECQRPRRRRSVVVGDPERELYERRRHRSTTTPASATSTPPGAATSGRPRRPARCARRAESRRHRPARRRRDTRYVKGRASARAVTSG